MKFKIISYTIILTVSGLLLNSCKKYLEKKPRQSLAIPSTLKDLQALLDNNELINNFSPSYIDLVADDYYATPADLQTNNHQKPDYVWNEISGPTQSWASPYQYPIYYSNVVLDQLPEVQFSEADKSWYNSIKGSALFYRAFNFYQLAQLFCKPYSSTASTDLGIVLKKTSAITEPITRSTVQQTYDQITNDLKSAVELLPDSAIYKTRPSKLAAFGLLARTYLSMGDYANAKNYADSLLNKKNFLLDYNSITALPRFDVNQEVIYYNISSTAVLTTRLVAKIDSNLYLSYNANDLRRNIFFLQNSGTPITYRFKGSYVGLITYSTFDGIATDEIYLIRAECKARLGDISGAMADLNTLMIKRWKNNNSTWVAFTATTAADAKNKIITERRKELLFRGVRWSDLRRFNLEGANITLQRKINADIYTLPPNDLRWVLLIPDFEVGRSGIPQNPR